MMSRHNPYKLFDYYTEADAEVFFGREREVSAVLGDILANKLLVLFAASGSGKTSLLNAGIGPALRQIGQADGSDPGIRMITIRLAGGVPPDESALRAIKAELRETGEDGETLHQLLRRLCAIPKPELAESDSGLSKPPLGLVLVFDQFEELFISLFKDQPETRREFGLKLAEIIHDETLRAYVVLSLRSDHFHHLNEFRSQIPSIFQNNTNLELRPFDHDAALRIIRGPADRTGSGFSWEAGLPERIVQDLEKLSDERGRVLPIHLQIVCYDLFERLAAAEEVITLAHYESTADKARMARGSPPAEAMIRRRIIDPLKAITGRELRRWLYRLLRELMTAQGAKFPRSLTNLSSAVPARHLPTLLKHLEKQLLVRRIVAESETYYELRHDFLARRISPWLEARENELRASDRRRRSVVIGVTIFLTGLITKLLIDWSTFSAYLGFDPRPDELRLERKAPFGMSAPSWWKRNIFTGYTRSQLLAAGLKQHLFAVERPLTDWKEVGDQLNPQDRWLLQLATRLETEAGKPDATNATLFETIKHADIEILAVADNRTLDLIISALKAGDLTAQRSAAEALGSLGARLPPERLGTVVEALLAALKEQNSDARRSVAEALGKLGAKLPPERVGSVIEGLLAALKEQDSAVTSSAAKALGQFGERLPAERVGSVIETLLVALSKETLSVTRSAAEALVSLSETLPPERVGTVVEALLAALKGQDSDVKSSAAKVLGKLGAKLPPAGAGSVIEALLAALKEQESDVKRSAAEALASLSEMVPPEHLGAVIEALLATLKEKDFHVKISAAEALINLSERLPPEGLRTVVEALLTALKEPDLVVKSSAAWALGTLNGGNSPPELLDTVVEALLAALKESDSSYVKSSIAEALGSLGQKLPPERVTSIVEPLLAAFIKEQGFLGKRTIAPTLSRLAAKLPPERVGSVVWGLLSMRDENIFFSGSWAAEALGSLAEKLPSDRIDLFVETLLVALKGHDSQVRDVAVATLGRLDQKLPPKWVDPIVEALLPTLKYESSARWAAAALGHLGKELPRERAVLVVEALLAALTEKDSNLKGAAADALGKLNEKIPRERVDAIVAGLLAALKNESIEVQTWVAPSLAILGARAATSGESSFFLELDPLPSLSLAHYERTETRKRSLAALRTLASAKWPQIDANLLTELESDDSRWRIFALHVLARRQPLGPGIEERVLELRSDPKGRPWVRLAALRCLVEIEREKEARRDDIAKKPN